MPKTTSEVENIMMIKNAYRDAELFLRAEEQIRQLREKEEEIFKTAWEAVKLGMDEHTYVEQKINEWK